MSQDQTLIAFGISSYASNAMMSDNPHSGIYEADTARALDHQGGTPACNQGGLAIVQAVDLYNQAVTGDIAVTLNAATGASGNHSGPSVMATSGGQNDIYDARGNGDGNISPTITGDHQDRITDYTAIVVTNDEGEERV